MEMSAGTAPVTWAVPYPCQNRRKTTVASGHPRTPLTASELGTRRSTPCAKRPVTKLGDLSLARGSAGAAGFLAGR
jgi:hypothetical protein